jgi:hypothetical protein
MILIPFVAGLAMLVVWISWLWRRTPTPVWAGLIAFVPTGLGGWCVARMAGALRLAHAVPVTLPTLDQEQLVAMHMDQMMRGGLRYAAAAFVATGWLLFVTFRWPAPSDDDAAPPTSRRRWRR